MTETFRKLTLLLLLSLLALPGRSQEVRTYEPFVPTPAYRDAFRMIDRGEIAEATRILREIAAQNPGTTLGAESLFLATAWAETPALQREGYLAIIEGYPRSRFEIDARRGLVRLEHQVDMNSRLQAYEGIAVRFGGPGLQEILRGRNRTASVRKFRNLPPEYQLGLTAVYGSITSLFRLQLNRKQDALTLAYFGREAFLLDPMAEIETTGVIKYLLGQIKLGRPLYYKRVSTCAPQLKIQSPRPNHRTGPRPKIRLVATGGDYRMDEIYVAGIQVTLDGQDLTPYLQVRSKIDTSLKLDRPFETLRITVRPPQRLSRGLHTISAVVPAGAGEFAVPARETWTFQVGNDRDDDYDECDDEEQDW